MVVTTRARTFAQPDTSSPSSPSSFLPPPSLPPFFDNVPSRPIFHPSSASRLVPLRPHLPLLRFCLTTVATTREKIQKQQDKSLASPRYYPRPTSVLSLSLFLSLTHSHIHTLAHIPSPRCLSALRTTRYCRCHTHHTCTDTKRPTRTKKQTGLVTSVLAAIQPGLLLTVANPHRLEISHYTIPNPFRATVVSCLFPLLPSFVQLQSQRILVSTSISASCSCFGEQSRAV
ncbi:hypothetical protein LZ30DRAFT_177826 [Colletotrichum cereale]|nr:hypothetical protein LZ30DRAFT_177826 [Colletotrichum cereale]